MHTDLSPFQRKGHLCERSLKNEGWVYWVGSLLCLAALVAALRFGLEADMAILGLAILLFSRAFFEAASEIARQVDQLAAFFLLCFPLSVSPTLSRFFIVRETDLPPLRAVKLFILPPPAAPSLSGSF